MKATIERAVLLKSLGHVQSVVERRNTIPILSNVLIEADMSGQLKLMATDLDLQVVETIAAKVETAGTTTVSAHTLFEIARKLPEGSEVSLAAAEGKMQVKAGRSNFNLPTLVLEIVWMAIALFGVGWALTAKKAPFPKSEAET